MPVWFLLIASGTVGFAFFLMELVWYRLLAPLLGGSVFTFGLVLAVALAGIGMGGLLYAVFASEKPASLSGFGWTCLIEASAIAATYALGDRIAYLAATLLPIATTGFGARIAGWTMVTADRRPAARDCRRLPVPAPHRAVRPRAPGDRCADRACLRG